LSLNQISTFEKEVEVELVKLLTTVVSTDFTTKVFVTVPLCLKDSPINRLPDEDVVVLATLFPIPTSNVLALGTAAFTFCFNRNETYPLVLAVIVFVGENANITCDPPVTVVFRYWATFPPSFVIFV